MCREDADCRGEACPCEPRVGEFMGKRCLQYRAFARPAVDELKRTSLRGGFVAVCAQGAKLVLQTATTMLLARLLSAEDFGLQGMAVVLTGFLGQFRDAGLSAATIQRLEVSHEDRKSTRLNSSHLGISYAVLC